MASQDEIKEYNWKPVLQTYGYLDAGQIEAIQFNSRAVLEYVMLDRDNDASLINNITRARENAKAVQDHITKEMWHNLNAYYLLIREPGIGQNIKYGDPLTAFDALIKHGLFLYGTINITMSRGEAYNFLNAGRYIERAIISTDVTDIKLKEVDYDLKHETAIPSLRYLLYSLSGYEAYLKSSRGIVEPDTIMKQILYDEDFVHSVLYCMAHISRYFKRLQPQSIPESYEHVDFLIGKGLNNLKYSTCNLKDGQSIKGLLSQIRTDLQQISRAFNTHYFGYT
ncbi:alpha-E domain-containing protein [Niabella ginsengisoli]|uniref:Alpha-E domain-containing protein n=1 Tax=Niabella ginsengisoli TaxID=522298 RepID=A0ABS9SQC1_9BACT|nr:alpha-E domain-containing protein [Niabella ginsengisoli]